MSDINSYSYQQIHDKRLAESICVAAIVKVMSFNPNKMIVNVQPLSKHLENGKYESQPPILAVPIACTKIGGFIMRPWVNVGDIGLVVYLDHDMDSSVSGGKESEPLTERNHSTTDAVFIGGIVEGVYEVKDIPPESFSISTDDGKICLSITKNGIKIKGNVEVTGSITASEGLN